MKMMQRSGVIRLVSGLLSRLELNERCPRSHLHFPSSHTVETNNVPTCPTLPQRNFILFIIFLGSRICRDSRGCDTDADYRPSLLSRFHLNVFPALIRTERGVSTSNLQTPQPQSGTDMSKLILTKYAFRGTSILPFQSLSPHKHLVE